MSPLAGLSLPSSCAQSPCRTITVDGAVAPTYQFYIYAKALGTLNNVYSAQITINILCGPLSADIATTVENPADGSVITFDTNGPVMYLDYTVVNTYFPSCGIDPVLSVWSLTNVVQTG